MKVIVLGAGGKQGSHAAMLLARKPEISELLLTDSHPESLKNAVAAVGSKAKSAVLDVGDSGAVTRLLGSEPKASVVLNTTGPGFRYSPPLIRAALDARMNYVDIQDDAEAVSTIAAFDGAARTAGVTVVTGIGLTPGLSGVLTKKATTVLDSVEEIRIFWIANMTPRPTVANWGHRLGIWASEVPIVEDGKITYVPGGSGEEVVDWPDPVGSITERLCAHPEPLTFHTRFPLIRNVSVRGGYTPKEHDEFVSRLSELGLTSVKPVSIDGLETSPVEFLSHYFTSDRFFSTQAYKDLLSREKQIGDNNGLRVIARGRRNGSAATVTYTFFSRDRNVGIYTPAAVATYLVALGRISSPGINFPEDLDSNLMFESVIAEGVTITESVT